jgi:hypothetical protein
MERVLAFESDPHQVVDLPAEPGHRLSRRSLAAEWRISAINASIRADIWWSFSNSG